MSLIDVLQNEWGLEGYWLEETLKMLANTMSSPTDSRDHEHYDKEPQEQTRTWASHVGLIENQGRIPMCVAQGCEVLSRVHTNINRGYDRDDPFQLADFDAEHFYKLLKQHDGYPLVAGTFPRVGMKCLKKYGIVENRPKPGSIFKVNEYWRCKNLAEVKNDLLTTGPVTICMRVFYSLYECTGIIQKPKSWEKMSGLHQVCAVSVTPESIGIINSWGSDWGNYGFAILPDGLFDQLVTEAWCGK